MDLILFKHTFVCILTWPPGPDLLYNREIFSKTREKVPFQVVLEFLIVILNKNLKTTTRPRVRYDMFLRL